MFDKDNRQILEAEPNSGVHYSQQSKFLNYDEQLGLKPHSYNGDKALAALNVAKSHIGKPYSYDYLNKYRTDQFYCSSLIWRGYYDAGWDIDHDGGAFVSPDDIYQSTLLNMWYWAK